MRPNAKHVRVGDQLQSCASRLAEFVRTLPYDSVPYEVRMGMLEAESAVHQWTEIRRYDK